MNTLLLILLSSLLQAQTLIWPISGKNAGDDILYRPQEYIGQELNFENIFIKAREGDVAVSPCDGVIQNISVVYFRNLIYLLSSSFDSALSFDENIALTDFGKDTDRQYYNVAMSIRLSDGRKVFIGGLRGKHLFKTGARVAAGDTLGIVGHAYKEIKSSSLILSFSDKSGKNIDPMTPFGLKTTFIKGEELTRANPMPVEKAREDLEILKNAFCELYPSLSQRLSKDEFISFVDSLKISLTAPIDPGFGFRLLIQKILHKVPDSHQYLYPDPIKSDFKDVWLPWEYLSFCDDTLRVLLINDKFKEHEGKTVISINGEPSIAYAKRADDFVSNYDAKVESVLPEEKVLLGSYARRLNMNAGKSSSHLLAFSDGTSATIPFGQKTVFYANDAYKRILNWRSINLKRDENDVFETRKLNDSTSYLALKTFEMLTEQLERIRDFLDSCKTENLIVDVRNNGGGDNKVLMQLLSYFAETTMDRQKGGYARVNKRGGFASLKYSLNYSEEMDIFPEYEEREDGYYLLDSTETCAAIIPDSKIHYGGRVYVLTNGHSFSAATLFPAVLVRNRRGVSVGRETGSGYHSMTALKFADIRLPNSLHTIRIPLVQLVFDTTLCERLPEARGLLPDYPFPLTYNEIMGGPDGKTDLMLEYALSLIADGHYLSDDDPFASFDKQTSPSLKIIVLLSIFFLFLSLSALFLVRKSKVKKS